MNPIEETYTCIPCLGYDDFLALTLPSVTGQLREVYVVTHPDDSRTIKVALRFGARLIVTKAWRSEEGLLDKGAAINCWMESTVPRHRNSWVLTLDADIFLPPGLNGALKQTRPGNLYSARRRLCTSKSGFARYESGQADMRDFDLDSVPIKDGKIWGRPTTNPAALQGYFQLWHVKGGINNSTRYPESGSAMKYDIEFAMQYNESSRNFISGYEVLHLGECKRNWNGRVTPRWSDPGQS